ncbi:MAG: hypothetical protein ACIAS6_13080 [Phycisphaerales bacterium JB060]
MRHAALRIGGVLLMLVAAALALAWFLRPAGEASQAPVAPRDVGDGSHALPLTQDTWLDAQPRASDPPVAPPAGFWRMTDTEPTPPPPDGLRLEIIGERSLQNVVLHGDEGRVHALTGFTQPQHVYGAEISPDGTLAWVWHMAYTPRLVSVYDLVTRELLHRFEQGMGGELRWAKHDPVIVLETYGMGMGGGRVTVFGVNGATIVQTGVGDYAFSQDDRWLLAIPFEQGRGRVEIYHVATGERLFHAGLPSSLALPMLRPAWDAENGPILHITTDRQHGSVEAFELARLVPILERAEGG